MTIDPAPNRTDFLLLMEDYQRSYTNVLNTDSHIASLSYDDCTEALFSRLIYYGDAYLDAFTSQGLTAQQIIPPCRPLQRKWAEENNIWLPPSWASKRPYNWYWNRKLKKNADTWAAEEIVTEQIKKVNPRYIWLFSGVKVSTGLLLKWKAHTEKIILWWACPIARKFPYANFDLILSGIPAIAKYFQARGMKASHIPHAFDTRILQRVPPATERLPRVAFVGSLSEDHLERIVLLDALSRQVEVDFYGTGSELLASDSPLRKRYFRSAWGEDLYSIYGSYLLVIHRNIGIAGRSISAKRIFEATGMGACVVTETTDDDRELFKPDEEIVTFSTVDECVEKVKYLLDNPQKAIEIGQRAQYRTLTEHTYACRVREIVESMKQFELY
jgi:spore maturation protein CgeB